MKKVKPTLSAAFGKVTAKRCAAVFSAAVVAVTSVTCIVQLAFDRPASAHTATDSLGSREILELSESYLSKNAEKAVSMLELKGEFSFSEEESETIRLIEELSTGSESVKTNKNDVAPETSTRAPETTTRTPETTTKTPETTTRVPETTTKAETTTVEATEVVADAQVNKNGYTFDELGISQVSDIDVPDDILFDENGIPLNYSRKLTGKSTAYCMGHTTATGTGVRPGVVAVNPNIIPYGSKMYIVASDGSVYGYSSAEDTGGFIYWNNAPIVDLYMYGSNACYAWGNKQVTIYIF